MELNIDELRAIGKAAHDEEWILGGCSGRMITTPSGYKGDGFIADVDTLANSTFIATARNNWDALLDAAEERDKMRAVLGKCIEAMERAWAYDQLSLDEYIARYGHLNDEGHAEQLGVVLSEAKAALNPEAAAAAMKEGAK